MHFSCPVCIRVIQAVKDVVVAINVFGLRTFFDSLRFDYSIVFAKLQNTKITRFEIADLCLNVSLLKHRPKDVMLSKPQFTNSNQKRFHVALSIFIPFWSIIFHIQILFAVSFYWRFKWFCLCQHDLNIIFVVWYVLNIFHQIFRG